MNQGSIVITKQQLDNYNTNGTDEGIEKAWEELLETIPNENLRKEAKEKGYKLVDNPYMDDDKLARHLMIEIPNASEELEDYLQRTLLKYVICLDE
jgi:hypothetical protein